MKIDFEFTSTIFVHDILNPPTPRRGSDITLEISNRKEFNLIKKPSGDIMEGPPRTSYDLNIVNPLSIGFTSAETSEFAQEFKNLILALNLSLNRSCITETNFVFSSPKFQFKPMKLKNEIREIGNQIRSISENVVIVSDYSFGHVSLSEVVDEKYSLDLFRMIQQFRGLGTRLNSSYTNLLKAINEFEKSMIENSQPFVFKHLFNALELSTNYHGEYTSDSFDTIVKNNTGISEEIVADWREFYNRVKHVDKSEKHKSNYLKGLDKVNSWTLQIRESTKKTIIQLLLSLQY